MNNLERRQGFYTENREKALKKALELFALAKIQWEKYRDHPLVRAAVEKVNEKVDAARQHPRVVEAERTWNLLSEDPEVAEGARATRRTVVNSAILVSELVPLVGDFPSWGADFAKFVVRSDRHVRTFEEGRAAAREKRVPEPIPPSALDLTPDVSSWIAVGTETITVLRAMTGFIVPMPTHWIEGGLQLKADLPRLRAGVVKARELLAQDRAKRAQDSDLQDAIGAFSVSSEAVTD